MQILHDFGGLVISLSGERLAHIQDHPEMQGLESAITETLLHPRCVLQSKSDPEARLYYRFYYGTLVGDKYMCVVVKKTPSQAFILTAYLTDRIKKGVQLWPEKE